MSITDTTAAGTATAPDLRVTHRRVATSEWIKLRSLRSTFWTLLALTVSLLGMGAITALGIVVQDSPPAAEAIAADPAGGTLAGVSLAQLAVITFGVLAVTGEYRTGTIRSSITAAPTRLPLVWGKAAVVGAVTVVVSLVALLGTFLVASTIVGVENLAISLIHPGVARAVLGGALSLGITAVLATGLGWLLRRTAGAISALVALLYVVPSIGTLLPADVAAAVLPTCPATRAALSCRSSPPAAVSAPGSASPSTPHGPHSVSAPPHSFSSDETPERAVERFPPATGCGSTATRRPLVRAVGGPRS